MTRESMAFDVVIVGGGPSGLSAAIRLAQLADLSICVVEKGSEIGAHIMGGAILEPRALNELMPDWEAKNGFPITPVTEDQFLFLTEKKSFRLPTPPQMKNHGNYITSEGLFCKWLAKEAEQLGVTIFPGFAVTEVMVENQRVVGVITGDKGIDKQGNPTARYQAGFELRAKQVILAEGCRGSLTQSLFKRFNLRENCQPQTYGLGIKELWEIPSKVHQTGLAMHSIGWPLKYDTYGGSFVYHAENNILSIGLVVGLDYRNPYLNPYEEFQRFKTHPIIYPLLENSKRIAYGARCINEGGFQSIPQLTFPGGVIVGCAAGFVNVPKIKGIHTAMKSGMIAAEAIVELLKTESTQECTAYPTQLTQSWVWDELYRVRNIRPAMRWGLLPGLAYAALDTYLMRGKAPWTFKQKEDYTQLSLASTCQPIHYPKHDQRITFDLMSSVYLTNSQHDENQPCHLKLKNPAAAIETNYKLYVSPETRYCPAGVYEIIKEDNKPRFQIHAANCIQCKACDIKDPTQNITWTPPEGGSGPNYNAM